jgi:hypothetical protein
MLGTVTAIAELIPSIWVTISQFRTMALNQNGILIAYRYEAMSNLNLLKELNLEALKDTDISKPEFRNLVNCLQTQVGASIFYDSDRKNYQAFRKSIDKIGATVEIENEGAEVKESVDTLLKAMRFSVDKIEHLKRLVFCASEGKELFNNFRLNVRIKNIMNSIKEILKVLPQDKQQ